MYMQPEDAAKGLRQLAEIGDYNDDLGDYKEYSDLSSMPVFKGGLHGRKDV